MIITPEAARKINEDLLLINDWSNKWLVNFSPQKTKDLIISNKTPGNYPDLILDNHPIERVTTHKHLGLTLSNDLSWKTHVYNIGKKAYNCIGILRPLKFKVDRATLETLYKSFIRPVLEYGDIIWHIPADHRHVLDILERVQLEAARLVTGATRRCPTEALYREVGWEKLASRRKFHRASMMHKIETGKAPTYLQDLIPSPIQARTRYNLRNRHDLQVPFARLESYSNSFFPAAVRLWNSLPDNIRQADTEFAFKYRYLKHFPRPQTKRLYYHGLRKTSVHHAKMRIGCSLLNYDLYHNLHVIQSPNCHCIMAVPETAKHFLLECPWYTAPRTIMYANLINITNLPPICEDMLLYGDPQLDDHTNILIFNQVHHFINQTNRFNI